MFVAVAQKEPMTTMTKREAKKRILLEFLRELLPDGDTRTEVPAGCDPETWDNACRELMYEFERRTQESEL